MLNVEAKRFCVGIFAEHTSILLSAAIVIIVVKRSCSNATHGNHGIKGDFICDNVYDIQEPYLTWLEEQTCVDMEKIAAYKGDIDCIYGWHISDLKIYDKPRKLSEFSKIYKRDKEGIVKCDHEPCDFIDENGRYIYHDCVNECPHFADKYTIKRPPQSWCYVETHHARSDGRRNTNKERDT